jgi:glycosyltransferase involved in cell wall biosynthesis
LNRLVFITQRVDRADPVLGATVAKIEALARRVDTVEVLAQHAAAVRLPANVRVRTFGAPDRPRRALRFERLLASSLSRRPTGVVAHMIPLYVVLAAPLVRPRRLPLVLWYTHWRTHATLRLAERLTTAVLTVDRRSFPFESAKVRPIGHGIDVSEFGCTERNGSRPLRALVLGRYSPAKGIPTILEAVRAAREAGLAVDVELYGTTGSDAERAHRSDLERLGFPLGDAVPRSELPALFARADVLVNNMRAGSPDKVVYEAAAACLPVLASNPVFDELFDGLPLAFARDDPQSLVRRLEELAAMAPTERSAIGRTLRERVVSRHSVDTWADGVLAALA